MCIKRILIHCNLYISTGLFEVYNHFCGVPIIFSFFQNCCCDCIFHMVCEQHLGDETSSSVKWQKTMESCNCCAGRTQYPKNKEQNGDGDGEASLEADIPNYCWDYSHSLNTCIHSSCIMFLHCFGYCLILFIVVCCVVFVCLDYCIIFLCCSLLHELPLVTLMTL